MHDQLADGCHYRLFSVIDDYHREGLALNQGHKDAQPIVGVA